jgi:hypothetical protein
MFTRREPEDAKTRKRQDAVRPDETAGKALETEKFGIPFRVQAPDSEIQDIKNAESGVKRSRANWHTQQNPNTKHRSTEAKEEQRIPELEEKKHRQD